MQSSAERDRGDRVGENLSFAIILLEPNPVQAICFTMKTIIAPFTPDKQHDKQATGYPDSQPEYIDSAISFMTKEITNGNFEIVS